MEVISINTYVPRGTVSYIVYNPCDDDYFKVESEEWKDLYSSYLDNGVDFEIRFIVEDGQTKIVLK